MKLQTESARIVIGEATDKGYPIEIEGPGGEFRDLLIKNEASEKATALTKQLDDLLGKDPDRRPQDIETQVSEYLRSLGQHLFEALNVDNEMGRAMDLSRFSPDQGLRVQLRIRDDQVETWPWELLYDEGLGKGGELDSPFLALSPRILLSRYYELPVEVPQPEELDRLRVLLVVANPVDWPFEKSAYQEIEGIKLVGETASRLEMQVLENATLQSLRRSLTQLEHPLHMVQFICHGYFDASAAGQPPKTGVVLLTQDGRSCRVSAKTLARELRESQKEVCEKRGIADHAIYPRLVTICACDSARTTSSVANALVEHGLPSVIGMRYPVNVPSIIILSKGLYSHLLDGYPIDQAVAECRRRLIEFNRGVAWSVPVLYLRAKDGILFKFNEASRERAHWLEQLRLLSELAGSEAEEAFRHLIKLGTSAIALSVAAALAYPLAAVRAQAAALLRTLHYPSEIYNSIINLIGPSVAYESDVTVRREMARVLAQPSPGARPFLSALAEDSDPQVQYITRPDLLFDHIHSQLECVSGMLGQLAEIVEKALRREGDYDSYLKQVVNARDGARELQSLVAQAQRDAASMTTDEVWGSLSPQVADWVENANRATEAAAQAARAANSLGSRLTLILEEVVKTLELELALLTQLDDITQSLNGVVISDTQGVASIRIARHPLGACGED